jgi:hypothetical protein
VTKAEAEQLVADMRGAVMKIGLIDKSDGRHVASLDGDAVPRAGDLIEVSTPRSKAAEEMGDVRREWFEVDSIRWHVEDGVEGITVLALETGEPYDPSSTPNVW